VRKRGGSADLALWIVAAIAAAAALHWFNEYALESLQ
jgi:hypothetical protein